MSASVSDIQQRLGGLDPSHENYRQLLLELLSHHGLKQHIHELQGSDLQGFIELLDEALNHLPAADDLFRKALRRLKSTCSHREALPSSHLIPSEMLSSRSGPTVAGDFADSSEAELDGKKVCIKTLRTFAQDIDGSINKIFYGEVVVWKRLQHPNIVPFLGVPEKTPPPFEIVSDLMENGTITEYVKKYPQVDRIDLLWDVADGLHYLHSCKIIHGNLKGANVMIDSNGHARLTDFGLTSIPRDEGSILSFQDSDAVSMTTWAAPEVLNGGAPSEKADVFTFAMVAVESLTGRSPFLKNYQAAMFDILSGRRPQRPETLSHDGLWDLIQESWNQDPGKRPTTSELLDFFRASFPRERGMPRTQPLASAPSTSTLVNPEAHAKENAKPRQRTSRRDTQLDEGEPGHPISASSVPVKKKDSSRRARGSGTRPAEPQEVSDRRTGGWTGTPDVGGSHQRRDNTETTFADLPVDHVPDLRVDGPPEVTTELPAAALPAQRGDRPAPQNIFRRFGNAFRNRTNIVCDRALTWRKPTQPREDGQNTMRGPLQALRSLGRR